ncbi:hypothetical protein [Roseibium aestuarii]|uniref:Uncharacterized protein n=1 Tax=Roseibium aestuarii TaxID=2600299 RepID=A0ABW4JSC6_9HYPH|nr:hypothetical protein [Roseibium aestuarii]
MADIGTLAETQPSSAPAPGNGALGNGARGNGASGNGASGTPTRFGTVGSAGLTRLPPDGRMNIREDDLEELLTYLQKVRAKARTVQAHAPAGSYLADVLERTLDGLTSEIGQLRHLLGLRDSLPAEAFQRPVAHRRMRPAS